MASSQPPPNPGPDNSSSASSMRQDKRFKRFPASTNLQETSENIAREPNSPGMAVDCGSAGSEAAHFTRGRENFPSKSHSRETTVVATGATEPTPPALYVNCATTSSPAAFSRKRNENKDYPVCTKGRVPKNVENNNLEPTSQSTAHSNKRIKQLNGRPVTLQALETTAMEKAGQKLGQSSNHSSNSVGVIGRSTRVAGACSKHRHKKLKGGPTTADAPERPTIRKAPQEITSFRSINSNLQARREARKARKQDSARIEENGEATGGNYLASPLTVTADRVVPDYVVPGAFRVDNDFQEELMEEGLGSYSYSEQGKSKSSDEEDIFKTHDDDILVQATLVDEEQDSSPTGDLVQAEPLVAYDILCDFLRSKKGRFCIIFAILIIAALVLGTLVLIDSDSSSGHDPEHLPPPAPEILRTATPTTAIPTNIPTPEPSEIPSAAPSKTPTAAPSSFDLIDHLPDYTQEALLDPNTPQSRAFEWLQSDNSLRLYPISRMLARFALATLYFSTDGSNWYQSENWLSHDEDECYWYSGSDHGDINCGNYLALTLNSNGLHGTLPPELELLSSLVVLDLSDNDIISTFPSELGRLTNLRKLHLFRNNFSGPIPSTIGSLKQLRSLLWFYNSLYEIPSELGNLGKLTMLRLENNDLHGVLPSEIGMLSSLETLRLGNNQLTGSIPKDLGSLTNLWLAHFAENAFVGSLPSEAVANWTSLAYLNFQSNSLTGELPSEIGELRSVRTLIVSDNTFSSTLPPTLGLLTNAGHLDLSNNTFSGEIPSALGLLTRLSSLNLLGNEFSEEASVILCQMENVLPSFDCPPTEAPVESSIPSSFISEESPVPIGEEEPDIAPSFIVGQESTSPIERPEISSPFFVSDPLPMLEEQPTIAPFDVGPESPLPEIPPPIFVPDPLPMLEEQPTIAPFDEGPESPLPIERPEISSPFFVPDPLPMLEELPTIAPFDVGPESPLPIERPEIPPPIFVSDPLPMLEELPTIAPFDVEPVVPEQPMISEPFIAGDMPIFQIPPPENERPTLSSLAPTDSPVSIPMLPEDFVPAPTPPATFSPAPTAPMSSSPTEADEAISRHVEFTISYRYSPTNTDPSTEEIEGVLVQTDLFFSELIAEFYRDLLYRSDFFRLEIVGYNLDRARGDPFQIHFLSEILFDGSSASEDALPDNNDLATIMQDGDFDSYSNYFVVNSEPFGTSIFFNVFATTFQLY